LDAAEIEAAKKNGGTASTKSRKSLKSQNLQNLTFKVKTKMKYLITIKIQIFD